MGLAIRFRLAVVAAGIASLAAAQQSSPEDQFNAAVEQLRAGQSADALSTLRNLTTNAPEFHLAQLVYGELLAAVSGSGNAVLPESTPDSAARLRDLADEAKVRLASEKAVPPAGAVPNTVLQLADSYRNLVLVDLPRARLYVLKNEDGKLSLVQHSYAAMGKNGARKQVAGDMRTPVGLYHVTRWIPDSELPELYGSGALPLDYPNVWDRALRRTGSGIWLHGVPRTTYSRPPLSSEGCVTMANDDLQALRPFVRFGQTPVILSDEVEWVPGAAVTALRDEFASAVEDWRARWSAKDTEGYLSYYDDSFSTDDMSRARFAAHKRRVNASKKFIDITLRDLSLFRYPGADKPLLLAEFTMDYHSNNYSVTTRKQQYWTQTATGAFKIVREDNR